MPSRRRFLVCAVTATGAGLLWVPPAHALGAPADDKDDRGEGSLAGWAPEGLVARVAWGADESAMTWEPAFSPVQVVTVHHSARPVGAGAAAEVRAIYDLHARRLGWGDVGYHLLIDPAGVLYEGRQTGAGGNDEDGDGDGEDGDHDGDGSTGHIPVFADGDDEDDRPLVVTGGHVRGHNPGNVGICLMGDFTRAGPTAAARATLEHTLATLCRVGDLDPLGTVRYVNPDTGAERTVRVISGHRDWSATSCPGATVAAELERIRMRVAGLPH